MASALGHSRCCARAALARQRARRQCKLRAVTPLFAIGMMESHAPSRIAPELTILMPCLNEAETLAHLHHEGEGLPRLARALPARS